MMQDIQKKINEQCLQMEPVIRPLITVIEKNNLFFVSVEVPGIDLADRPCYYRGQGRMKGSFIFLDKVWIRARYNLNAVKA